MTKVSNVPSFIPSDEHTAGAREEHGVRDLGIFTLPPALTQENVVADDTRLNSEGYTSRIYMCCQ